MHDSLQIENRRLKTADDTFKDEKKIEVSQKTEDFICFKGNRNSKSTNSKRYFEKI